MPTQPDESTPTRRKLGSVDIERNLPVAPGFFCYDLRHGDDIMSGSRPVLRELWAAAEQFEALQALARLFRTALADPDNLHDFEFTEAAEAAMDDAATLGALGKEDSSG